MLAAAAGGVGSAAAMEDGALALGGAAPPPPGVLGRGAAPGVLLLRPADMEALPPSGAASSAAMEDGAPAPRAAGAEARGGHMGSSSGAHSAAAAAAADVLGRATVPRAPMFDCKHCGAHNMYDVDALCYRCLLAASAATVTARKRKRGGPVCIECKMRDVDVAGEKCDACVYANYTLLAAEQSGSALKDTVHLELLDYLLTIVLMRDANLTKEDMVDIALGYLEMALPRPIPAGRVEEHVRAVFPQLHKCAKERSTGRPLAAGEAFNPAVHKWDVAATHADWALKYAAAYDAPPPDPIVPLSILRERRAQDAARELEDATRLLASKAVNKDHALRGVRAAGGSGRGWRHGVRAGGSGRAWRQRSQRRCGARVGGTSSARCRGGSAWRPSGQLWSAAAAAVPMCLAHE